MRDDEEQKRGYGYDAAADAAKRHCPEAGIDALHAGIELFESLDDMTLAFRANEFVRSNSGQGFRCIVAGHLIGNGY